MVTGAGILLTDVSDHFAPFLTLRQRTDNLNRVSFCYRNFEKINKENFCLAMQSAMSRVTLSDDPDNSYNKVCDQIIGIIDKMVPLQTVNIKAKQVSKPWITTELKELIKDRHKLYKKYLKKTNYIWQAI